MKEVHNDAQAKPRYSQNCLPRPVRWVERNCLHSLRLKGAVGLVVILPTGEPTVSSLAPASALFGDLSIGVSRSYIVNHTTTNTGHDTNEHKDGVVGVKV